MGTGRAAGRHNPRMGEGSDQITQGVDPDSPEGREYGMSKRVQGAPSPIPGGKDHISNAQSFRHKVPAPAPADFTDLPVDNVHGVPPGTHNGYSRAQLMRGKLAGKKGPDQYYTEQSPAPRPVPVYVVENADKTPVFRSAAPRNIQIPLSGTQPVQICGTDPDRVQLMLLNESSTTGIRIGYTYNDVQSGGGALLPAGSSSYTRILTQDTLYAISTSSSTAPTLSLINVYDQGGTGL
jgi:hypothetical protein